MIKSKSKTTKLLQISLILSLILIIPTSIFAADDDEEFDANDEDTWDYNSNEVYENVDPDDERFDWSKADYTKVDFSQVDDYSKVDMFKVPDSKWNEIDQSKIHQGQITQIPAQHFNPKEVTKEDLKYATSEQISSTIGEFDNLADANPSEVSKVFSEDPYGANIDLSQATQYKYNIQTGMIEGNFPSYNPADFPKLDYIQTIAGDSVKIQSLEEDEKGKKTTDLTFEGNTDAEIHNTQEGISLSSLEGSTISGVGNIVIDNNGEQESLELDNLKNSKLTSENGELLCVKCNYETDNIKLEGTFKIDENNQITLGQTHPMSATYTDKENDVTITTTNEMLEILTKEPEKDKEGSYIYYNKDEVILSGKGQITTESGLTISSKTESSYVKIDGEDIYAKGIVHLENDEFNYYGKDVTTTFERTIDDNNVEQIKIDSESKKDIAYYAKKTSINYFNTEINKRNKDTELEFIISRNEDGEIVIERDNYEQAMQNLMGVSNGVYNPRAWVVPTQYSTNIQLGDEESEVSINLDLSTKYELEDGTTVEYVDPQSIMNIFGEQTEKHGDLLLQTTNKALASADAGSMIEGETYLLNINGMIYPAEYINEEEGYYNFESGEVYLQHITTVDGYEVDNPGLIQNVVGTGYKVIDDVFGADAIYQTNQQDLNPEGKETKVYVVSLSNNYIQEQIIQEQTDLAISDIEYDFIDETPELDESEFNIVTLTGHHVPSGRVANTYDTDFSNERVYGDKGGITYSEIPQGTDLVKFSACETIPKLITDDDLSEEDKTNQNTMIENYVNSFPDSVKLIEGYNGRDIYGNKGLAAPAYDTNIADSLTAENIESAQLEPETYIQNMLESSRDNGLESGGTLQAVNAVLTTVNPTARFNYQMSFLLKKEDGWYYYDSDNPNGVKAIQE